MTVFRINAAALLLVAVASLVFGPTSDCMAQSPKDHFRQLDDVWPTPNDLRRPSGAPGEAYWQQQVDYDIQVKIDERSQTLTGTELITYHNNSPDTLDTLWLQLDQNRYANDSDDWLTTPAPAMEKLSYDELRSILYREQFDGAHKITAVKDANHKPLQ